MTFKSKIWLGRVCFLLAIFLTWEGGVRSGILPQLFFGSPSAVGIVIWDWLTSGKIYPHLAITLLETMLAFALGTASGRKASQRPTANPLAVPNAKASMVS